MSSPSDSRPSAPSSRWESYAVGAIFLYYFVRLLWFAVRIAPGVFPDEPTHVGIIGLYEKAVFLVQDSPETWGFGLMTHVPFLYYALMGKLSLLNVFPVGDLIFLRFLNVLLSMATLLVAWKIAQRITQDAVVRVLFLVMLTNTLMATFLGAAVSYDNLVNLLAALAIFFAVDCAMNGRPESLLALFLCGGLGALTKISFLPLLPILLILVVLYRRSQLMEDMRRLGSARLIFRGKGLVLAAATLVVLGANLWLYGGNLARFGTVQAPCSEVLELEQCLENRIFARNWIVAQFRNGEMTLQEAMAATARIKHEGDRNHAIRLLRNELAWQEHRPDDLPRWNYMGLVWDQAMKPAIYGIQAHRSMLRSPSGLLPYNLILFAALILWTRGIFRPETSRVWWLLGFVVILYFAFLVGYYNYGMYRDTHAVFQGVQGRYLFPVLVPACLVAARFVLSPVRGKLRYAVMIGIGLLFILGDWPHFLREADEAWYRTPDPIHGGIDAGAGGGAE